MNGTGVKSLEDVFKKWEKKGEERRQNPSRNAQRSLDVVQPGSRAAWVQKFETSSVSRRRPSKRRNQSYQDPYSFAKPLASAPIERKFQLIPPAVDDLHRSSRPFLSTGCPRCCHKSKAMFITEKETSSLLRNLLDISVFCRKNLFRKVFGDVLYVVSRPISVTRQKKADVMSAVLKSSRVNSALERLSSSNTQPVEQPEQKETKEVPPITLQELKLQARNMFFGKIMSSIQLHQGQVAVLHKASGRNIPLVYLPLHKSHVDYVLISFALNCYGLKVPYIAAGENLKDIPVFSWLMRNMGGFFIKRNLGNTSPQNELYRVILDEYIAQVLASGNSLEVYIEGTRSRTGKYYPPKIGILSSIVSAVSEGQVSDVLIVPVNISYEQILESGYCNEVLGEPKKMESFLQTVRSIWRIARNQFGQVRIDFGLPFSLKELIQSSETSEACQAFMKAATTTRAVSISEPSGGSIIKTSVSEISLETLDCSIVPLTKCIAYHVIYDCVNCSTIMGTNMVAFLLLTKFRKGVELKALESAFEDLKKDVVVRKRDYGFSGSNEAVIFHSLNILGKELFSWNSASGFIEPNHSLPAILRLAYFANQVISVFLLESVVACSIGALMEDKDISFQELVYQNTTISRKELVDTALTLCDMLRREFVFCPPCVSLETSLIEAIEGFIAADILNVHEDQSAKSREKQWANRLAASTSWSDEDDSEGEVEIPDQEYKINSSEEAVKKLKFFRSILSPIIESYWFVACGFLWLCEQDFTEQDFMNKLYAAAISRVKTGTALFNESCCSVYLNNAVKVFKDWEIIFTSNEGTTPCCLLKLNSEDQDILTLISQINRYKS